MTAPGAWVLRDGVFHPADGVPVSDRGFRYGMSVFETVAVRDGRRLFEREHLDALKRASQAAGFSVPVGLPEALQGLDPKGDGMLRLYVTAGEGAPLAPAVCCGVYALYEPAAFPTDEEIGAGYRIGLCRAPIFPVLGGWKTGNYWPHVQALAGARQQGLDEAVLVNAQGEVVSAAMANLFVVVDGELRTPPLDSGARDGIVRNWVTRQLTVREVSVLPEDLERAEECFLTNSRLGVMPVREVEGRGLPGRKTGAHLAESYREKILRH